MNPYEFAFFCLHAFAANPRQGINDPGWIDTLWAFTFIGAHYELIAVLWRLAWRRSKRKKTSPTVLPEPDEPSEPDEREIVHKVRLIYRYPPDKAPKHSVWLAEYTDRKSFIKFKADERLRDNIFSFRGINWYIGSSYESGCKGPGGKTRLLVVMMIPMPDQVHLLNTL